MKIRQMIAAALAAIACSASAQVSQLTLEQLRIGGGITYQNPLSNSSPASIIGRLPNGLLVESPLPQGKSYGVAIVGASNAAAGFVDYKALGTNDEGMINAAILSRSATISGEVITAPAFVALNAADSLTGWSSVSNATLSVDTGIKRFGTGSIKVTPGSTQSPGASLAISSQNFSNYTYLGVWLFSADPGKIRFVLRSGSFTAAYYTKLPRTNQWCMVRMPRTFTFETGGSGSLSSVTNIEITMASGSIDLAPAPTPFYIDAVSFIGSSFSGNRLWHPGSQTISNSANTTLYIRGTDYDLDYELGEFIPFPTGAITSGQSLRASYRYGGGEVRMLPGDYWMGSTGIAHRSYVTLDLNEPYARYHRNFTDTSWTNYNALIRNATSGQLRQARIKGGSLYGYRSLLSSDAQSIHAIYLTNVADLRIENITTRDWSGSSILIGSTNQPSYDIVITGLYSDNDGTQWTDMPGNGAAERYASIGIGGSALHQGTLSLVNVDDAYISGASKIYNSGGDATSIRFSRNTKFIGNTIRNSKMGAYFLEGGERHTVAGNTFDGGGSRMATFERDSFDVSFVGNTLVNSGRDAIWINGSSRTLVSGNIISMGGNLRRTDSLNPASYVVRVSATESNFPVAADNIIVGNTIIADSDFQLAAIIVATYTNSAPPIRTRIEGNILVGSQKLVVDQGIDTVYANAFTRASGSTIDSESRWVRGPAGAESINARGSSSGVFQYVTAEPLDADVKVNEMVFYHTSTNLGVKLRSSSGVLQKSSVATFTPSTNWTPANLSNLVFWADSVSSVGGLSDGNPVDLWSNLAPGGGGHAIGTLGSRPTYVANAINGRGAIRFAGTSTNRLTITNSTQSMAKLHYEGGTIVMLLKFDKASTTNSFRTIAGNRDSQLDLGFGIAFDDRRSSQRTNWFFGLVNNGTNATNAVRGVQPDSLSNLDDYALLVFQSDPTNSNILERSKMWINGGPMLTNNTEGAVAVAGAATRNFMFGSTNGTQVFVGDIAAAIITVDKNDTNELRKTEGFIAHQFGVTNILAADHPYKATAP